MVNDYDTIHNFFSGHHEIATVQNTLSLKIIISHGRRGNVLSDKA